MALTQQDSIETRALTLGAFGNIGMAVVAWFTYWYSNSEAILLDGNYSFIIFLGMGVALSIARVKAKLTETFPLGQFFYEALYCFVKGLMIFGVILMAVVTSPWVLPLGYSCSGIQAPPVQPALLLQDGL